MAKHSFHLTFILLSYHPSQLQNPHPPINHCPPFSPTSMPSFLFRKDQAFQGYQPNSKQTTIRLGTNPYLKAAWGNPVGGKWSLEQAKESEVCPLTDRSPQNPQAKQSQHVSRGPSTDTCKILIIASVSVSSEPCLVDLLLIVLSISLNESLP